MNTRSQHFNKIRKVLGLAVMKELIPNSQNSFNKGFAVREVETESKSLTLGELMQIESIDMTLCPDLIKTRDMFLLSCYTGLRFSDLSELTTDNFAFLDSGKIRLAYLAAKTKH